MKLLRLMGMTLIALSLFVSVVSAADPVPYPQIGPQTKDKYYFWGTDEFPKNQRQGISITLDQSSTSYQTIKATVSMDWNLITDRSISKFVILANGVAVDEFEPYWDSAEGVNTYREVYWLDVDVDTSKIGSYVYFHVLGIREYNSHEFVVAWSQETPTVRLKPFPVTDSDTHGYLAEILEKLNEMTESIKNKLDSLKKAVEDIYTVKPETQARFDASLANLQSKLPTEQMKEQIRQVEDLMDESKEKIERAEQHSKFGQISWMGEFTTDALDFDALMDEVTALRRILQIVLWCEFFFFVIFLLRPKLTV